MTLLEIVKSPTPTLTSPDIRLGDLLRKLLRLSASSSILGFQEGLLFLDADY